MDAKEILELVAEGEEYLPILKEAIPLIQKAGVEIRPLLEGLIDNTVDLQVRAFKRYIDNDLTREEALVMCINSKLGIERAGRQKK